MNEPISGNILVDPFLFEENSNGTQMTLGHLRHSDTRAFLALGHLKGTLTLIGDLGTWLLQAREQ